MPDEQKPDEPKPDEKSGEQKPKDEQSAQEKPPRKPPPLWLVASGMFVGAIVLLVFAAWAGERIGYAYAHESTDDARIDADSLTITSKISERVERIDTDTNRYVRRGQLLVQLDDRDERSRLAAALASRNATAAQLQEAKQTLLLTRDQVATESEQSRGSLDSARSNESSAVENFSSSTRQSTALADAVAQAEAQARQALAAIPGARENVVRTSLDLARDSALVRNGDVAQSDVDADRAAYETALSNLREDQANVAAARANVANARERESAQSAQAAASAATIGAQHGSVVTAQGRLAEVRTPYRISTQEAAVATAQRQLQLQDAQVRLARDQLSYTRVLSPADGAVAEKAIGVGQTVGAGQTLLTLVPTGDIYVTANYKETQLNLMRVGQPVDIHVDGYPEFSFVGHIAEFNPASENEFAVLPPQNSSGNFVKVTQRVPVRIYVDRGGNRAHPLRPGMSVETYVRVR